MSKHTFSFHPTHSRGGVVTRKNLTSGFTIVELLIVIVVIAILATLVVAAYNGITTQANNSKTAAAVQAYKKALLLYAQEKGEYPRATGPGGGWFQSCLGENYEGGRCWAVVSGTPNVGVQSYFNNQLKPYLGGQMPMPSANPLLTGSYSYIGAIFYYYSLATLDGGDPPWLLGYVLAGSSKKCPVGPIVTRLPGNEYSSSNITGYSSTSNGNTLCFALLPEPNEL